MKPPTEAVEGYAIDLQWKEHETRNTFESDRLCVTVFLFVRLSQTIDSPPQVTVSIEKAVFIMNHSKELTRKKTVKVGNITVTVRSNEPSEESIRNFNSWINKKAYEKASEPVSS